MRSVNKDPFLAKELLARCLPLLWDSLSTTSHSSSQEMVPDSNSGMITGALASLIKYDFSTLFSFVTNTDSEESVDGVLSDSSLKLTFAAEL